MKGKQRKSGGRTEMWVSGNPDVKKEAEMKGEGGSRKRGGKVRRAIGGKVSAMRLDRPGRKMGGRVGADKSPLSSAHKGVAGASFGSSDPKDTYGGTPSD